MTKRLMCLTAVNSFSTPLQASVSETVVNTKSQSLTQDIDTLMYDNCQLVKRAMKPRHGPGPVHVKNSFPSLRCTK